MSSSGTPSILSRNSKVSAMMQPFQPARPVITIQLKGEDEYTDEASRARAISFTTMDRIEGTVTIKATVDTRFDELYIGFEGKLPDYTLDNTKLTMIRRCFPCMDGALRCCARCWSGAQGRYGKHI